MFGQKNSDEDDSKEVIRVVKYSKDWERISSASLYGANTTIPFNVGSLRMTENNGYLYIHTCHTMYASSDGLNHQANMTLVVQESDMTVEKTSCVGYVSHSFNQFIMVDDEGNLIALDHGDAYPRAAVLTKNSIITDTGAYGTGYRRINVFTFQGDTGTNYTGAAFGGLEYSNTSYLVAGCSVDQDEDWNNHTARNVFVAVTSRDDFSSEGTTVKWITDYDTDGNVSAAGCKLVKIREDYFMLLWETSRTKPEIQYAFLDGEGNVLSEIYTAEARLSDCQPIVSDGVVTWYATGDNNGVTYPYFYSIDESGKLSRVYTKIDLSGAGISLYYSSSYKMPIDDDTYSYRGTEIEPYVTVIVSLGSNSNIPEEGTDYIVEYSNNINAGIATVTVTGVGDYYTGVATETFIINKTTTHMSLGFYFSSGTTLSVGETRKMTSSNGRNVEEVYSSSNPSVLEVSEDGVITAVAPGEASVIATIAEDENYVEQSTSMNITVEAGNVSDCSVTLSQESYTYDGTEKTPTVILNNGSIVLTEGTDYEVAYSDNINVGTASATVTGCGNYTGMLTKTFTISKADQNITAEISADSINVGDTAFVTVSTTEGAVTYSSSNTSVATIDSNGEVTGISAGIANITVTAAETDNYNAATATIAVLVKADTLMVRRGTTFYFNYTLKGGNADFSITAGEASDQVLVGDWDGDGVDTICLRRGNYCYFIDDITTMHVYLTVTYGRSGDEVLVGDWDDDGCDSLAMRRNGNYYYFCNNITNPDGDTWSATYGRAVDEVHVGDWEGSGYDSLAVRRDGNHYYFSLSKVTDPDGDVWKTTFGRAGDEVLVGDWDGNGTDTLAMRRNGNTYFFSNSIANPDSGVDTFTFGRSTDEVYAGTWK